jgi:putative membrane protein
MLALCVLVVVGIVLLVRGLWSGGEGGAAGRGEDRPAQGDGAHERALGVLEERYARGEIEREEFFRRKADLQG